MLVKLPNTTCFSLVCIVKNVNGRGIGIFIFHVQYAKLVTIFHGGGITVAHVLGEDALGKCD